LKFSLNTSIPVQFETIEQIGDSRFVRGKVWICHTGKNLNNSIFSKEVIEAAIPSLANIPVLGFIEVNNLNQTDFKGHEQRLIIDKNGVKIEYLGRMYGIVPESNNAKFEWKMCDDGIKREFLTAEVLLHTKFPECIDIIQRDGVKGQSMELQPESIKGKFNKDGLFEFTEFKFEGLCLLGDDVIPAMRGSELELFTQYNYQEDYIELLKEFNSTFSQINVKDDNKGGNQVDEKLELFNKYPTLKEEDVAELKANLEKYTLEELENELIKRVESQNKNKPTQTDFALTAKQFEQELRAILSQEKVVDRWGDTVRAYWYIDHDENRVYAEDTQNNYLPVGINYTVNGDKITIDFSTKKRIKWVPQDIEDGTEAISLMSVERNQYEIEKINNEFSTYKTDAESKLSTKQTEYQQLVEQFNTLKDRYTAIEDEYTKLNAEYAAKLKAEREEAENEIFTAFAKELTEEEMAEVKNNKDNMELDEIKDRLFALVGKKKAKLNFSIQDKPKIIDLQMNEPVQPKKTGKSYEELIEKYRHK